MALNESLNARNGSSADEFYTQKADIEAELRHYTKQFRGKVVLCNCDDPYESNFFKYFAMNFNHLGLKKLITTSFVGSPIVGQQLTLPVFDEVQVGAPQKRAYKVEITEVPDADGDGAINLTDVEYLLKHKANVITPLKGDGDFRSEECVALLKEVDIVVTNPPFSLIKEFIALLIESKVKFLVLGDQNFVTRPQIFEQVVKGNLWFGYDNGGTKWFQVPDDYDIKTESRKKVVDGVKYFSMGRILWFTNLDTTKRHEKLTLYKKYNPVEYPTYTNYPAIEVSKVAEIPMDYEGQMGVPITFLAKYNPKQFKIIGNSEQLAKPMSEFVADKTKYSNGGRGRFYIPDGDKYLRLYDRIVIQRIGDAS